MRTQLAKPGLTPVTAAGCDVMRAVVQDVHGSAGRLRLGVLAGRRNDGKPPWTFIAGEQEPGERPRSEPGTQCGVRPR